MFVSPVSRPISTQRAHDPACRPATTVPLAHAPGWPTTLNELAQYASQLTLPSLPGFGKVPARGRGSLHSVVGLQPSPATSNSPQIPVFNSSFLHRAGLKSFCPKISADVDAQASSQDIPNGMCSNFAEYRRLPESAQRPRSNFPHDHVATQELSGTSNSPHMAVPAIFLHRVGAAK